MKEKPTTLNPEEEPLSSDILALCALLARILLRCLRERDPRILELLSLPPQEKQGEEAHDQSA